MKEKTVHSSSAKLTLSIYFTRRKSRRYKSTSSIAIQRKTYFHRSSILLQALAELGLTLENTGNVPTFRGRVSPAQGWIWHM